MLKNLTKKAKELATSEATKKGTAMAKDFAVDQVKDQVNTVKTTFKLYLYGAGIVLALVIIILGTSLYKIITL